MKLLAEIAHAVAGVMLERFRVLFSALCRPVIAVNLGVCAAQGAMSDDGSGSLAADAANIVA